MAPAGAQPTQKATGTTGPTVQRKKFQVVPVPGEFSRGRWKCVDTRGLSNGEFGNYPADDEYKTMVSLKNNAITVRKKFLRRIPEPEKTVVKEIPRESHIQVTSSVSRIDSDAETNRRSRASNDVEVTVMPPQQQQIHPSPVQQSSSTVILSSHTHITPNPAVLSSSPIHVAPQPLTTPKIEDDGYRTSKLAASTSNTVVAIDNKIVQAMDLVKTHLTFAVREEVETLRSTISDLENRLTALREENRILRDNASPEVLAFINANNNICKLERKALINGTHIFDTFEQEEDE